MEFGVQNSDQKLKTKNSELCIPNESFPTHYSELITPNYYLNFPEHPNDFSKDLNFS
jgi:hypothetical protein